MMFRKYQFSPARVLFIISVLFLRDDRHAPPAAKRTKKKEEEEEQPVSCFAFVLTINR